MVPPALDSVERKSLRTDLDSQVALLPAVLQSADSVSLVDHLTSVFSESDWNSLARCSNFSATAQLSQHPPAGWLTFQGLLQQGTNASQTEAEQQAMSTALGKVHESITVIQRTTCFPKPSSAPHTDKAGRLQAVHCSVCHSLLLAAAFNNHLPSCRPCSHPIRPSKGNDSQPASSGRAASTLHKSGSQGKGKKKVPSKGSKKPPAGPSRFAVEQTKHTLQQPAKALQGDASVELLSRMSHAQPDSKPSSAGAITSPEVLHTHLRMQAAASDEPAQDAGPSKRDASSGRLAWTYESHMSRSNPDVDAVHEPTLPPRFPQGVCRTTRRRSRSASQELPHFLSATPESPSAEGFQPANSDVDTCKLSSDDQTASQHTLSYHNGHSVTEHPKASKRQRQHAHMSHNTAGIDSDGAQQWSAGMHMSHMHGMSQQPVDGLQLALQQHGSQQSGSVFPNMAQHATHPLGQQGRGPVQGRQYAPPLQYPVQQQAQQNYGHQSALCSTLASHSGSQPSVQYTGQLPGVFVGQGINTAQDPDALLQQQQHPAVMPPDRTAYTSDQSMPWQTGAAAVAYPSNGYSPTALHVNPWRMPVSKQRMSMNALARMPYHT